MHSLQHTWQHCATKSYLKQTFHCQRCIVVLYPHVEQLSEPHGWGYVAYNLGKTDTQQLGTMSRYSCDPAMTQPQGQQSHDSMFTNMRRTYVHTCFPGCTAQGHGDIDSITFCHCCCYDAVSDFALNADGDKNPWARVSVGLSNMNLTSAQAFIKLMKTSGWHH